MQPELLAEADQRRAARCEAEDQQQLLYLSSGRWMFEQPHEWVPLVILLLVPAGRVWGLDHRLVHRGIQRLRGFPF